MTSTDRYSTADKLPPLMVPVRVFWTVGEFVMVRRMHLEKKHLGWVAQDGKKFVWLPYRKFAPRGAPHCDWDRLKGDHPSSWWPLYPDKWDRTRNPLPEPTAAVAEGVVWSPRSDIDAADAAEMLPEPKGMQWWRDATDVRYQPAGTVSREMCEARVMRALCYDRTVKMDFRYYKTNAAVLADLKRGLEVLFGDPGIDWRPPYQPNNCDGDDYLIAMRWVTKAQPTWREWACLWGRVADPPFSWEQIGDRITRTRATTKRGYDAVMFRVHAQANRRQAA